jgi:acid phosphatase family membrane protein YuiD
MHGPTTRAAERSGREGGRRFSARFGIGVRTGLGPASAAIRGVGTALAGVFGAAIIARGIKSFIDEARQAARVTRQTEAVLKATGGAAKITAKQVANLAQSISNKVGVDDEAIQSGLNLLLTFRNVRNEAGKGNDVFNQASTAIVDMTAAMNNGRVTSEGLKTTTIAVGKALQDPIRGITALRRVGVTFTEQQKKQITTLIESGHTMEAQKIILRELSQEFGGAARAAADPWQRFGVAVDNLKERIGTALLPVMSSAANFLTDKLVPATERFAGKVSKVVVPAFATLTSGIQKKFDEFKPDLETFKTNLVAGVKKFVQPILDAFSVGLKTGDWKPFGAALAVALRTIIGDGVSLFQRAFAGVDWLKLGKALARVALPFIVGFVNEFGSNLIEFARAHPMDMIVFLGSVLAIGKMGGIIGKLLSKVPLLRTVGRWFEGLNKLTEPINRIIGKVVGFIGQSFIKGFAKHFPEVGSRLGRWVLRWTLGISGKYGQMRRAAIRFITGLIEGVGSMAGRVSLAILRTIERITRPFRGAAGWLVRRGFEAVAGLVRGIGSMFAAINRAVGGVISRLINPFRPAGRWLINAGQNLVAGLRAGISSAISSVGGVLRRLKDAIVGGLKRLFGIGSPSKVMAGIGANLVAGLVKGLVTNAGSLKAIVKSIGGGVVDWLGDVLGLLTGGPAIGRGSYGSNRNTLRAVARSYGWDTGAQWIALVNLISGESGFNNLAQNPNSSAFGMGQFLDSTWATVGMKKTADAWAQSVGIMRYIAKNYGSPAAAYGAWLGRTPHWYGEGGIFTKPTIIGVGERGPEAVVPLERGVGATYNINVAVAATADQRAIGAAIVKSIEAYEGANGKSWRTR